MFDLFKKDDFLSVVIFLNGDLSIALLDFKGNVYKTIKCEDENVYNYFLRYLIYDLCFTHFVHYPKHYFLSCYKKARKIYKKGW